MHRNKRNIEQRVEMEHFFNCLSRLGSSIGGHKQASSRLLFTSSRSLTHKVCITNRLTRTHTSDKPTPPPTARGRSGANKVNSNFSQNLTRSADPLRSEVLCRRAPSCLAADIIRCVYPAACGGRG